MLRTPNALFEGSKAYSINYGVMRKIKPEVWSKAFNDPTWIRYVFKFLLAFDWSAFGKGSINLKIISDLLQHVILLQDFTQEYYH